MTAREEQESTITVGRLDEVVRIYTSDMRHLRRLRILVQERDFVREIRGGGDWGEFECDVENFYLFSALRVKAKVSEETRAARAAHLAGLRAEAVSS